jgi:hypothetical protein
MRSASWKQMIDVAQAADWVITGPVRPYSIDSMHAPIEHDRAGKANGLTWPGPFVASTSAPMITCSMPPPPVLTATATRSRCSATSPIGEVEAGVGDGLLAGGHREVDEAAHPAGHLAVHRDGRVEVLDLGRDAHVEAAGVEGRDRAAARLAGDEVAPVVGWSLPMGVTAPMPVMTARRDRSWLGKLAPGLIARRL